MPGTPTPSASSRAGRPRPGRNRRVLAVIVLTAAVVTAALSVTLGRGTPPGGTTAPATVSTPEAQEPANPELLALARRDTADPLALGSPDAPVVLIDYSDFQCPFCGRFARETKPALVRDYVDKGILRIEWRDFPVFGAESDQAARAGWAAGQQDRFWQSTTRPTPNRAAATRATSVRTTSSPWPGRPASRTSHGSRRTWPPAPPTRRIPATATRATASASPAPPPS
ncbi:DsbA family protein [Streptomyces sp. RK31]|uniref:DsbA family protein n=1 Tax=Streptomyces sp. RK31 TaxID=2824892 RepID=UPI0035A8AD75